MSLPLSPPPSRSSSQSSETRISFAQPMASVPTQQPSPPLSTSSFASSRATKNTTSATAPPPPPLYQPQVRAIPRPKLAVQPPMMGISFLDSASTAESTNIRSVFSPCSSDEESEDEDNASSAAPRSGRSRMGKYQRLWAKQPPKTPFPFALHARVEEADDESEAQPSPRRPSLASPTFGMSNIATPPLRPNEVEPWSATESIPPFAPTPPTRHQFSVPPSPAAAPDVVNVVLSHDADMLAAQTRLFQTRQALPATSDESMRILQSLLAENEKALLKSMQTLYSTSLAHILQPNPAKSARERLLVQTQKAHLRRAGAHDVASLHRQLAAAEEDLARMGQQMLQHRLEEELNALEKHALGQLEAISLVRRRMKGEHHHEQPKTPFPFPSAQQQAQEEEEESNSSTPNDEEEEFFPAVQSPIPELDAPGTPLPALSPEEEMFLAAVSRAPSPDQAAASKIRSPPQRPQFSPKLPLEFMNLPALVTTPPTPSSRGSSPASASSRFRRATFGSSPLSSSVTSASSFSFEKTTPLTETDENALETVKPGAEDSATDASSEKKTTKHLSLGDAMLCTRVNGIEMSMI